MELCLITPIVHLDYTRLLAGRFCLANIAASSKKYRTFFIDSENTILDNGVFEGDLIEHGRYLELSKEIRPATIIAPDQIGASTETNLNMGIEFAKEIKDVLDYPVKVMFVPQCKRNADPGEVEALQDAMLEVKEFDCFGICRDFAYNAYGQHTRTIDQELNRFYLASLWTAEGYIYRVLDAGKSFHFLGIGDRVDLIQFYWFVNSMDTASFFWQGLANNTIKEGKLETYLSKPSDYFKRAFDITGEAKEAITVNCTTALHYAQQADRLRNKINGKRI